MTPELAEKLKNVGRQPTERRAVPPAPKSTGLGDTLAKVIAKATRGRVQPCEPCKKRKALLNRIVPYK